MLRAHQLGSPQASKPADSLVDSQFATQPTRAFLLASLFPPFPANCSRLRCKTVRSTDAKLSNVFSCIVSLQFAILLRFSSFFLRVVAPASCLGPPDPSPHSLGLSSTLDSGGCLSCALICAVQGRMSVCRTGPAANPGGPQGGAQTGRRPGGGWREADPSWAPKPNVVPPPCGAARPGSRGTGDSVNPK